MVKVFALISLALALNVGLWRWTRQREPAPPPALVVAQLAPSRSAPAGNDAVAVAAPAPDRGFLGVVVAGDPVDVTTEIGGRIAEVHVEPGDPVARGATIAEIDVRPLDRELTRARAAGDRARVRRLERARAAARITAPVAGTVTECFLGPGAQAARGAAVARVIGRTRPHVRFAVPQERAEAVTRGVPVEVKVSSALTVDGVVTHVRAEVDLASRMVYAAAGLELAPAAQRELRTGQVVRVRLAEPKAAPDPAGRSLLTSRANGG